MQYWAVSICYFKLPLDVFLLCCGKLTSDKTSLMATCLTKSSGYHMLSSIIERSTKKWQKRHYQENEFSLFSETYIYLYIATGCFVYYCLLVLCDIWRSYNFNYSWWSSVNWHVTGLEYRLSPYHSIFVSCTWKHTRAAVNLHWIYF